jgi:hypothetical protein
MKKIPLPDVLLNGVPKKKAPFGMKGFFSHVSAFFM